MISGIVYTSNSGYTAQYARLLGAALDLPVTDAKWGADPHPGRAVIYLGWLMAGKVQGYAKAAKEFDIRAVCAVGMGPASQAGAEKVRAKMGIPGRCRYSPCRAASISTSCTDPISGSCS